MTGTKNGENKQKLRTDVQRVVISAEAVDDRLLRGRLVPRDPVGLAVLRDRLRVGRTRDPLSELLAGRFRTDVERGALADARGGEPVRTPGGGGRVGRNE